MESTNPVRENEIKIPVAGMLIGLSFVLTCIFVGFEPDMTEGWMIICVVTALVGCILFLWGMNHLDTVLSNISTRLEQANQLESGLTQIRNHLPDDLRAQVGGEVADQQATISRTAIERTKLLSCTLYKINEAVPVWLRVDVETLGEGVWNKEACDLLEDRVVETFRLFPILESMIGEVLPLGGSVPMHTFLENALDIAEGPKYDRTYGVSSAKWLPFLKPIADAAQKVTDEIGEEQQLSKSRLHQLETFAELILGIMVWLLVAPLPQKAKDDAEKSRLRSERAEMRVLLGNIVCAMMMEAEHTPYEFDDLVTRYLDTTFPDADDVDHNKLFLSIIDKAESRGYFSVGIDNEPRKRLNDTWQLQLGRIMRPIRARKEQERREAEARAEAEATGAGAEPVTCPKCESTNQVEAEDGFTCQDCSHRWPGPCANCYTNKTIFSGSFAKCYHCGHTWGGQ